ncbi:MAG: F0F1 ATP synthase subunit B [Mycobacteriaceae bacterium]
MTPTAVLAQEQEHNPLLPETFDIVWSAVCVAVIFWVFWKYVLPKFQEILTERTEKIEGGIAKAEQAQAEARAALERYNAQLAEARGEAARIRDDARSQGQQIIEEMKAKAQQESDRIVSSGHSQLMAQRQQIVAELRSDLGRTSVDLAERLVGESLTDEANRSATVDRFLDELDAMSPSK